MKKTLRLRVMLITAIIGVVATIFFGIFVDADSNFGLIWGCVAYYPIAFLIVAGGFRWKWKNNAPWIASLVGLPFWVFLIGGVISRNLEFLKWYTVIGITISVIIFEYNLLDQ